MVSIGQDRKFGQESPRYACKRASFFKAKSEAKGYVCKCRDPRCSLACNRNWSNKLGTCLSRHLNSVQDKGFSVYRGDLMMPPKATPGDHQAAKAAFLLSLKRWAKRWGYRVELQGVLHVTAPDEAHWDVVLWTDAPKTPLHDHFGKAWKGSGGHRQSLVVPDDLDASAHYQAKPVQRDRDQAHYLPAAQSVIGLDCQWSTRGFWDGSSLDQVWGEFIEEWKSGPTRETDITDTPKPTVYVPGTDQHWDEVNFARKLPTSPDQAVSLTDYAQRWGVHPDYMQAILDKVPGVVRTSGETINGKCSYQAVYMGK